MTTRAIRQDLSGALIGFGVVFAFVFIVGRIFLPSSGLGIAQVVAQGADQETSLLDELGVELAALNQDGAVIEWSGAIAGRSVLDHVSIPFVWVPSDATGAYMRDGPVDVNARYSRGGGTLAVIAGQAMAGQARTAAMTVLFTIDGQSFTSRSGDCSLELSRSGYHLDLTPTGAAGLVIATPYFTGHVICKDVAEIRSGETVSFTAVFRYEPPTD
ncbi:MAG: hypothetical protein WD184_04440 [Acidimicrobiia bacterium]